MPLSIPIEIPRHHGRKRAKNPLLERIAIIGLGYVGLPLATAFGKRFPTVGFDISVERVRQLERGMDATRELNFEEICAATHLKITTDQTDLAGCDWYIVTVPTPVDSTNNPDLSALGQACEMIGPHLSHDAVVVFESTVYPGCTRDFCVPLLEQASGLIHNEDFFTGYSPERINPGDRERTLSNILKVTSGSTPETAQRVDDLYREIINAGTFRASSIEVAEAAKVIENTQRDLNIALINELSILFDRLGLDTRDVLNTAGTKWNFLPFEPGLVGGHCIGVDPYYLTHCAQQVGYHPEVILAGRRINDGMAYHVANRILKLMIDKKIALAGARVLICGLTFKEDCADLRNSKVFDLVKRLREFSLKVDVWDPVAESAAEIKMDAKNDLCTCLLTDDLHNFGVVFFADNNCVSQVDKQAVFHNPRYR